MITKDLGRDATIEQSSEGAMEVDGTRITLGMLFCVHVCVSCAGERRDQDAEIITRFYSCVLICPSPMKK